VIKKRDTFKEENPKSYNMFLQNAGNFMGIMLAKMLYDPKYGSPDRIEDFT